MSMRMTKSVMKKSLLVSDGMKQESGTRSARGHITIMADSLVANITIVFKSESSTSDVAAWQSSRSLAMTFASLISDTSSSLSQSLSSYGVDVSSPLSYVSLFTCNDGSVASSCPTSVITSSTASNGSGDTSSSSIGISTWWVIVVIAAGGVIVIAVVVMMCRSKRDATGSHGFSSFNGNTSVPIALAGSYQSHNMNSSHHDDSAFGNGSHHDDDHHHINGVHGGINFSDLEMADSLSSPSALPSPKHTSIRIS
jgi:hypothetical protein